MHLRHSLIMVIAVGFMTMRLRPSLAENLPFPWSDTNLVELLDVGGDRTVDDVIGSIASSNEIYCTKMGNGAREVRKYTLTRDGGGNVMSATLAWSSADTLPGANLGLKALDMFNSDSIYYTLEQGGGDSQGLIALLTGLSGVAPTITQAADTSGIAYHPEGIAIDRMRNELYVMNDDGNDAAGGGGAFVAQYMLNIH